METEGLNDENSLPATHYQDPNLGPVGANDFNDLQIRKSRAIPPMGKRLIEGYASYGFHVARGWAEKAEEEARIRKAAIAVCKMDAPTAEPQENAIEVRA